MVQDDIDAFLAGRAADASRVTLRALTDRDQEEFLHLVEVSADLHHPYMPLPATKEAFEAYLARFDGTSAQGLLVCLRDSGTIAGTVNINSIIRGRFQNGSIAYAAFAPAAGQGYMAEGVALVVRYAFERLRLHRLEAQIQPENEASLKLIRRLGFHYEGRAPEILFIDGAWRDHERFALTASAPWIPHTSLPAR